MAGRRSPSGWVPALGAWVRSLAPFRARFAADFAKTSFCENHNHRGNPRVDASVDAGVEQKMRDTGTADTRSAQGDTGDWRSTLTH